MPQITEEQGRKILEKEGYKVEKFLGRGLASIVFKCIDPKNQFVAVKLCALDKSDSMRHHDFSEATLDSEIKASEELENMKKEFQDNIDNIDNPEEKAKMKKCYNGFFKYTVRPVYIKSVPLNDGSGGQCGIFESKLADGTVLEHIDNIYMTNSKTIPQPDYKFFKSTARKCLKCLQNIHESGRVHGDVATRNILVMKNERGKTIPGLTDFSTMHRRVNIDANFFSDSEILSRCR